MKKIGILIAVLIFSFGISIPAYAAEDRVVDYADLLSDTEEKKLSNEIEKVTDEYNFDVVIVTVENSEEYDVVAAADDYYDYNGYGYGDNSDGILFYINIETRNWAISTSGYGLQAFTDYGTDTIGAACKEYLSEGEYYQAFNQFVQMSDKFLEEAETGTVYDINHTYKSAGDYIIRVFIVLVIALIIAAIVIGIMKSKMKTAVSQPYAKAYVKEGSFNLTRERDSFLYSHTSKTAIPKSNSSGGGTSSHSSSSGSSHGGSHGSF